MVKKTRRYRYVATRKMDVLVLKIAAVLRKVEWCERPMLVNKALHLVGDPEFRVSRGTWEADS